MRKTIWGIVAVTVAILTIVFIGKSSRSASTYVVKIGNIPIMQSKLPLVIAQEKGFFKDAGVEVAVTELASSNLVNDALLRGDLDITPEISILPFINAQAIDPGKLQIFSVTDLTQDEPFDSIIVRSDSAIQTIDTLSGKKIGVFPGTTATNMLKLFFKEKGIDTSRMQFIQLPPTEQLSALSSGAIDALHAYEPTISIALADGKVRKIYSSMYAEQVNHNPIGGGVLTTEFATEHPEEARRVVEALNRAYDYIRTHEKESREIAQNLFKFTPHVTATVSLPYFNHSEQIDKSAMNKLLDLFVAGGEIKSKPDLSNAYYQ